MDLPILVILIYELMRHILFMFYFLLFRGKVTTLQKEDRGSYKKVDTCNMWISKTSLFDKSMQWIFGKKEPETSTIELTFLPLSTTNIKNHQKDDIFSGTLTRVTRHKNRWDLSAAQRSPITKCSLDTYPSISSSSSKYKEDYCSQSDGQKLNDQDRANITHNGIVSNDKVSGMTQIKQSIYEMK